MTSRRRLLGPALILVGVVWGVWLLGSPSGPVLEIVLGAYLAYRWVGATGGELGLRPWELAAGIIFILDAIEDLTGVSRAGHEIVIVYPGLIFLAGVIYLFDRRARTSARLKVSSFVLTLVGTISYYHQFGFMASVPIGNISGILTAIFVLVLWYRARRPGPAAVVWVFAIAASLLIDSVVRLTGHDPRWLIVAVPILAGAMYLIEPQGAAGAA